MALQRPARLLRFDKIIDNKGLIRIRVGSNCRKMRVFRDHESETGKVPLGAGLGREVLAALAAEVRLGLARGRVWTLPEPRAGQRTPSGQKIDANQQSALSSSGNKSINRAG